MTTLILPNLKINLKRAIFKEVFGLGSPFKRGPFLLPLSLYTQSFLACSPSGRESERYKSNAGMLVPFLSRFGSDFRANLLCINELALFRGKTGIRTLEPLWAVTRFPDVPLQPLEHLSSNGANIQINPEFLKKHRICRRFEITILLSLLLLCTAAALSSGWTISGWSITSCASGFPGTSPS